MGMIYNIKHVYPPIAPRIFGPGKVAHFTSQKRHFTQMVKFCQIMLCAKANYNKRYYMKRKKRNDMCGHKNTGGWYRLAPIPENRQ